MSAIDSSSSSARPAPAIYAWALLALLLSTMMWMWMSMAVGIFGVQQRRRMTIWVSRRTELSSYWTHTAIRCPKIIRSFYRTLPSRSTPLPKLNPPHSSPTPS